jgi:cysteine synthase B
MTDLTIICLLSHAWLDASCMHARSGPVHAGTIMGVSRFLKEQNPGVQIVGLQPSECASIAGIRRWPKQYLPKIFEACP